MEARNLLLAATGIASLISVNALAQDSDLSAIPQKGTEFQRSAGVSWQLVQKKDELSGINSSSAKLTSNANGARVDSELTCKSSGEQKSINVRFIVTGAEVTTVRIPQVYRVPVAPVRTRINETVYDNYMLPDQSYRNVFDESYRGQIVNGAFVFKNPLAQFQEVPMYGAFYEFKTNRGNVVVKMPLFDKSIQEVIKSCK